MEFLGNISNTVLAVCGVVCLCGGGLAFVGFFAFRYVVGGGIFSALSHLGALFDNFKQDDDDQLDDPVHRIHTIRHSRPSDMKARAKQSFDFDAQVAEQLKQQGKNRDFDSQVSPNPPQTSSKPQSTADNRPTSDNTPASSLGKRRLGARDRYNSRDDMLPDEVDPPEIDLGPMNLPDEANIKWQKNRPGRDRRRDRNRTDDEIFGGILDEDGDGFPEL